MRERGEQLESGSYAGTGGRPSEYSPDVCEKVIAWGRQGKSRAWICDELGVVRQTLKNWEASHPEFLVAMERAKLAEQRWFEEAGQSGMFSKEFNASIWSRSMAARFPDDWREVSRQERSGPDGGPQQVNVTSDAVAELTRRLARLTPAGPTGGDAGGSE